jgi:hypothetical protein
MATLGSEGPVVILGEADDLHVLSVRENVARRGVPCLVIDERTSRWQISYTQGSTSIQASDSRIWTELECARSVWWWRKETTMVFSRADDFAGDFALREYRELLESLETLLGQSRWPIRPSALRTASLKCHQLDLAQQLGFRVPLTLVTNDAASVADFVASHRDSFTDGRVLYKPLTWYVGPPDRFLFANVVTLPEITSARGAVSAAPCQFQEYIE